MPQNGKPRRSNQQRPKQPKSSRGKNSRRIKSAEDALAAIPHQGGRRPRGPSRPSNLTAEYVQSLHSDVLIPTYGLPSPNYAGPVTARSFRATYQLVAANHASLASTFVMNPYLVAWTQFAYEKLAGGANAACLVPTSFANNATANHSGIPVSSSAVDHIDRISFTSQNATNHNTAYTGKVRVLGVKYRLTYTGTWNNRGGELLIFTNPDQLSLICQEDAAATGGADRFLSGFNTGLEIDNAVNMVTRVPIGDTFEWVWRPTDLQFRDYDTYVPDIVPAVAATSAGSITALKYLPSTENPNSVTPMGWTSGFQLRPATGTVAQNLPYRCDIEVMIEQTSYLLEVNAASGTVALGTPLYNPSHHVAADSASHDKITNALARTHAARTHTSFVSGKSLALVANRAKAAGSKYVTSMVSGLAEASAARLMSMLF